MASGFATKISCGYVSMPQKTPPGKRENVSTDNNNNNNNDNNNDNNNNKGENVRNNNFDRNDVWHNLAWMESNKQKNIRRVPVESGKLPWITLRSRVNRILVASGRSTITDNGLAGIACRLPHSEALSQLVHRRAYTRN